MIRVFHVLAALFALTISLRATEEKVFVPAHPNGDLLIYAHGYRPDGFPNPATLDLASGYEKLARAGWIIASTSYRKTGFVVAQGADDIDRLRDRIEKQYGPIRRCLLHGESMGGTIVTLLAGRDPRRYQGALAVGAALDLLPGKAAKNAPKIPLLFLTNRSELDGPAQFVKKFSGSNPAPVLWKVDRDGHCNVNPDEVAAALSALDQAVDGRFLKPRDGTIVPARLPSQVRGTEAGFEAAVRSIDPIYGNFMIAAQVADLQRLGYGRGDYFLLKVGSETRKVFFGKEYNDVPQGAWVAFENADGFMRVSMNFRNAAEDLQLTNASRVQILTK